MAQANARCGMVRLGVASGKAPRGRDPSTYRNVRAIDLMVPEGIEWQETLREEMLAHPRRQLSRLTLDNSKSHPPARAATATRLLAQPTSGTACPLCRARSRC
jgi:hypothetical protein